MRYKVNLSLYLIWIVLWSAYFVIFHFGSRALASVCSFHQNFYRALIVQICHMGNAAGGVWAPDIHPGISRSPLVVRWLHCRRRLFEARATSLGVCCSARLHRGTSCRSASASASCPLHVFHLVPSASAGAPIIQEHTHHCLASAAVICLLFGLKLDIVNCSPPTTTDGSYNRSSNNSVYFPDFCSRYFFSAAFSLCPGTLVYVYMAGRFPELADSLDSISSTICPSTAWTTFKATADHDVLSVPHASRQPSIS